MNEFLEATYIGWDKEIPEISAHPNGKYYRAKMKLNDREVTAILVEDEKGKGRRKIKVIGWYDLEDSKYGSIFRKKGFDKYFTESKGDFEHAEPEIQTIIDLSQLELTIPYDYVPDESKTEFYKEQAIGRTELNNQLFYMKKRAILETRKVQFQQRIKQDESEMPEISLSNILPQLSEEEKQEAKRIFDRTLRCVLYGKYSYNDYITVMKHLTDIVKNKGIVISKSSEDRILKADQHWIGATSGKETTTFVVPGDSFIAKRIPTSNDRHFAERNNDSSKLRRILDINYGTDGIVFYSMENLKEEEDGQYYVWCDGKNRPTKKSPLGVIGRELYRPYSPEDSYLVFKTKSGELAFIYTYFKDDYKVKEQTPDQDR